jgi:hypothetical protein
MGFVRKVEASVTPEDRKKHGEWCQHIAPERVMAALTAVCHEKVKILITIVMRAAKVQNLSRWNFTTC